MIDRLKLAKVLARMESSSDAEALTAARTACKMVRDAGTTFDLLLVSTDPRPQFYARERSPRRAGRDPYRVQPVDIMDLVDRAITAFDRMTRKMPRGR